MATPSQPKISRGGFLVFLVCLAVVLLALFGRSFRSGLAHFSNDGPLGVASAACFALPEAFTGVWVDLNWVGAGGGGMPLNINSAFVMLLGPVGFAKFMAPLAVLILGVCAWVFFRQLKLPPWLCLVAGLAAALNSNFFSNVCWGLGSRAFTVGMIFLALAALMNVGGWKNWVRLPLAGMAVGMSIMDGADNGAIFSLYVAAFAFFHAVIEDGGLGKKLAKGVVHVGLVAAFAGFLATQTVITLIGSQVTGITGMQQDAESKEARFDWATQWSLPKVEILRVLIPGLHGYRMDTPEGGQYWGNAGQQPGYQQHHQGFARYSGAGEYAGVLVVLIALWAVAQSFAKNGNPYGAKERKLIWFWTAMAVVSVLLAFGRYAPFYRLIFSLPFFSTIRNPIKFMHVFHLVTLILFGYGLLGLSRRYLEGATAKTLSLFDQLKSWWGRRSPFEKRWTNGCAAFLAASVLGGLFYAASHKELERYLMSPDFDASQQVNAVVAGQIAGHSITEVALYILFLIVSLVALLCVMSGAFAAQRARQAAFLLGFVVVLDLGRANLPWIKYYNYAERYASDPVVQILRDKPYEHRVAIAPFGGSQQLSFLQNFYHVQWLQHHFPYYSVQSLDIPQEPRVPADKTAYRAALGNNVARLWQLTNTRYVLGAPAVADFLNQQLGTNAFRVAASFDITPKPGAASVTSYDDFQVAANDKGPLALLEYTRALPRASLYSRWQVSTNDQETLKRLADPAFDPAQLVLVSKDLPAPPAVAPASAGTVAITGYSSKRLQLRAQNDAPAVLLVNDKYDPDWKVTVDGQPAELFRANFLVRGVYLPAGQEHQIEFSFKPKIKGLYVSLSAILLGVVLGGLLVLIKRREPTQQVLSTKPAAFPFNSDSTPKTDSMSEVAIPEEIQKCFRALEVEPGASAKVVKEAYLDLVKIWHPDRISGGKRVEKKAQERLKEINLAFERIKAFQEANSRRKAKDQSE